MSEEIYVCFVGNQQEWCGTLNIQFHTTDIAKVDQWIDEKPDKRWFHSFTLKTQETKC